jgi:ribosomal protein S18 acetylase RimI-like enzyme
VDVEVRRATPAEGDEIGRLTEEVYRAGGFTTDDYSRELLDGAARVRDAIVLVATLEGRLVASVTLAPPGTPFAEISRPHELEVRMLAVAADARRLGIADRLMDEAEATARSLGLTGVVLSTEPDMHDAHRLYERRGYVRQPDRDWDVEVFTLLVYALTLPT